jgi:cell fate regulator YaaT (PSP1 superfamily)
MTEKTRSSEYIAIRFNPYGKLYHFEVLADEELKTGDYVIVTTSHGREMGQVISFVDPESIDSNIRVKPIDRRASPKDLVLRRMWERRELEAMIECRAKAAELGLATLKIAKAEFSYDGSRLNLLYATESDEKIDLKKLQRAMQRTYRKSRVELRQIGPRDVAQIIGGMGACGLEERCCSRFMTEFSPISIRMAKAQGVSLNPQEITGMCGRLRCCLLYEYEQYVEARKRLPKRKKRVVTPLGEGKVIDVLPLKEAVIVLLDEGMKAEFMKHEIQPWEELKALRDKADKPCNHEGGCTCGKKNGK